MTPGPCNSSILVSMPKYVTIKRVRAKTIADLHTVIDKGEMECSDNLNLRQRIPSNTTMSKVIEEQNNIENLQNEPKPKKRRLDHLTWEEKMQRK